MLGVLVFLPRKFLDFWHSLPRSWQFFLAKFARIWKIFQDGGKKSKKILEVVGNKSKNNQDFGKRNKKSLSQSNTRFTDILQAIIFENSKKGLLLCVLLSEPQLGLTKKNGAKINWNKIEAKIKQIGIEIMLQTSSVKMFDFFPIFFGYTNGSILRWKKSSPSFFHRVPET